MSVIVTIEWDPSYKLEDAVSINCSTTIEAEDGPHTFSMELDSGKKWQSYLNGVSLLGFGITGRVSWEYIENVSGRRVCNLVGSEMDDIKAIKGATIFHRPHYIVTRDEVVGDENWCAFYGSSGFRWDSDLYSYSKGTFPEQFIQTIYDETHVNPGIHKWTNAAWEFFRAMDKDEELQNNYEEVIQPIVRKILPHSREGRVLMLEKLLEIPLVRDTYNLQSISL